MSTILVENDARMMVEVEVDKNTLHEQRGVRKMHEESNKTF
jgi:hypothetical protein